jgi:beta-lactamase regulating signal transducer with metallopeptidase domain
MQEGHIPRMELATRPVISTTQMSTQEVNDSSSSPKAIFNMRRSKASRPLTMLLILMLMLLIFLICHIMILMLLICLGKIRLENLLPYMLGHTTRGQKLMCGCPSALLLT